MSIKITMDAVINFLEDEGLGPIRIKKKDTYDFELAINEPSMWGTSDHKMRCGIGTKDIEQEDGSIRKQVLFHAFKALATLGAEYSGHWYKFVKNIKGFDTFNEAKNYFLENYLLHEAKINLDEDAQVTYKPPKQKVVFKDHFEKIDPKDPKHRPYLKYMINRGVQLHGITNNRIFVDQEDKRIIFPVYEHNNLVFYTGRDITGNAILRWKKSDNSKGVHPIWNLDKIESNILLVFEGIFDAIHFHNGIALLGIGSEKQFKKILGKGFSKIILIFDNDIAGREARYKWAEWLAKRNYERVFIYDFGGIEEKDFASMFENGIDPEISLRTFHWDYKTKVKFQLGEIK